MAVIFELSPGNVEVPSPIPNNVGRGLIKLNYDGRFAVPIAGFRLIGLPPLDEEEGYSSFVGIFYDGLSWALVWYSSRRLPTI